MSADWLTKGVLIQNEAKFLFAFGVTESPEGDSLYGSPPRPYFSMKKSRQKSLGEDPETPDASVRPDRQAYDLPDLGLDDAYKVFILIRFLLNPN